MWNDNKITPAILLQHMQGMEQRLNKDMKEIKQDVHVLKQDVRKINFALQRLYERRIETVERIDSHDVRIGKLEKHVGLVSTNAQ